MSETAMMRRDVFVPLLVILALTVPAGARVGRTHTRPARRLEFPTYGGDDPLAPESAESFPPDTEPVCLISRVEPYEYGGVSAGAFELFQTVYMTPGQFAPKEGEEGRLMFGSCREICRDPELLGDVCRGSDDYCDVRCEFRMDNLDLGMCVYKPCAVEEGATTTEETEGAGPTEAAAEVGTAESTEAEEEPTEETKEPTEETKVATEETEVATEETEVATEETEVPAEETEVPAEETEVPAEETEVATEETEVPAEEATTEELTETTEGATEEVEAAEEEEEEEEEEDMPPFDCRAAGSDPSCADCVEAGCAWVGVGKVRICIGSCGWIPEYDDYCYSAAKYDVDLAPDEICREDMDGEDAL